MPSLTSRATGVVLGAAATIGLVLSGSVVFGLTDDSLRQGEGSQWVTTFIDPVRGAADPDTMQQPTLPTTFGGAGPARTLVLFDGAGPDRAAAELDGLTAAQLATHFGRVQLLPVADYTDGQMGEFDALVYVGTADSEVLPQPFLDDVRDGGTPVLWAGANIDELAGPEGSPAAAEFISTHGWDASTSVANTLDEVHTIRYHGVDLVRDERIVDGLIRPEVTDPDRVEVLGTALCGGPADAQACRAAVGTEFPWAIRSVHLTYVGEVPFDYMEESSRYLAFADLYYDLLAPETETVRSAAVRLEDVGPEADPADLRRIGDFLHERDIPFQVAVMPVRISPVPGTDGDRHYGISLLDRPAVVDALKYLQERGGTLIQHGTTHQYGEINNPYNGATGADYEFYRAGCSATAVAPFEWEDCVQTSWVRLTGPVSQDAVEEHAARLAAGRQVMVEAGLGEPTVFEVPHYAASPNAYQAIDDAYGTRYGRGMYFAGLTTGETFPDYPYVTQFFPYRVHDVYGSEVLPENLGNVTEEMQNNHEARGAQFLVDNARANLAVRESTASFFFHPFLETAYLEEVVTGIEDLGYTFVPADELP